MPYVKHILFFCGGLLYSAILTFFGLIYSGMGHGTGTGVFWALAVAPVPFIFWAIIGLLLCWRKLRSVKITIVCLLLLHYLTFALYSYVNPTNSEYEDFTAAWQRDPGGIILTITFYLFGQIAVWSLLIAGDADAHSLKTTESDTATHA